MDVRQQQAFASNLTSLLNDVRQNGATEDTLRAFLQDEGLSTPLPSDLLPAVHAVAVALLDALESASDDASATPPLEAIAKLLEWLPSHLLASPFHQPPNPGRVVELTDDSIHPIGHRLILSCLSIPYHPSIPSILHRLAHRLELHRPSIDPIVACLTHFAEDVRSTGLPVWTAMKDIKQGSDALTPPKRQRMIEARRLLGVTVLIGKKRLTDRIVDRLLPCGLFVLDDYDSEVACHGAVVVDNILDGIDRRQLLNWHHVIHRTLCDRILSSDATLWKSLPSLGLKFSKKLTAFETKHLKHECEKTGWSAVDVVVQPSLEMRIFEKTLERLRFDAAPFELADVFLETGREWIQLIGANIVRYFSTAFPLLIRWSMHPMPALQIKTLDTIQAMMDVSRPRIVRHVEILNEVFDAMEARNKESTSDALNAKIRAARDRLTAIKIETIEETKNFRSEMLDSVQ